MRILIIAAVVLFLAMYARALYDVFTKRHDLSGSAKAAWAIILLIVPFVGLLVYMMMRPGDSQIARRA
jgi:hypothetical protein